MARFRVSPSRLARFCFHDCERYLRYSTATREQRAPDGIPPIELDRTLVTKAILESGYDWDRRVLTERAIVADAPDDVDVTDRRPTADATLALLGRARDGDAIYQPTLRAPASFYATFGLDPDLVQLVDCHPDLVSRVRTSAPVRGAIGRAVVVSSQHGGRARWSLGAGG